MPRRAAQGRRMTHGRLGRMQTRWPRGAQYSSHDKRPPRRPFGRRGLCRFALLVRGAVLFGSTACARERALPPRGRSLRAEMGAARCAAAGTAGCRGERLFLFPSMSRHAVPARRSSVAGTFLSAGRGMPRPARPQLSQRMTIFISVRAQARSARPARRRGGHLSFGRARVCRALCGCSFCGG